MLRIAHVSDLHVVSPKGIDWRRMLLSKRITGLTNLVVHRARSFRRGYLQRVIMAAAEAADHLVVTGDLTNLALGGEFAEARRLLDACAPSAEVTVIPGNHDLYVPESVQRQHFARQFAPFLKSDLPGLAVAVPAGRFPVVKLRGPVALIALSSAVPRPPFVSAGRLGRAQVAALEAVLHHPEVASRTPVVLVHHDPMDSRLRIEQMRSGLVDADALRNALAGVARGLILFGHLHLRRRDRLPTAAGILDVVCASGASLDHRDPRVRAGYNLYCIGDDGNVASIEAWVLDPGSGRFRREELPSRGDRHERRTGAPRLQPDA